MSIYWHMSSLLKSVEQVPHRFVETLRKFNSRVVYHNDGHYFGSGKWVLLKNSMSMILGENLPPSISVKWIALLNN